MEQNVKESVGQFRLDHSYAHNLKVLKRLLVFTEVQAYQLQSQYSDYCVSLFYQCDNVRLFLEFVYIYLSQLSNILIIYNFQSLRQAQAQFLSPFHSLPSVNSQFDQL